MEMINLKKLQHESKQIQWHNDEILKYEPHHEKTGFLPMRTAKLISASVFTRGIVQFLFLKPKFQASSLFLKMCSLVYVGTWSKTPKTGFLESQLTCPFVKVTSNSGCNMS